MTKQGRLFVAVLLLVMLAVPCVMAADPEARYYMIPTDKEIQFTPNVYDALVYQNSSHTIAVAKNGTILSSVLISAGTDDIPIQAAIDYINPPPMAGTGGLLFLSSGSYILSQTVTVQFAINIVGAGSYATFITTTGNHYAFLFDSGFNSGGIEKCRFSGTNTFPMIKIKESGSIYIRDCRFEQCSGGAIELENAWGCDIANNWFMYCSPTATNTSAIYGHAATQTNTNILIDHNIFENNYYREIYFTDGLSGLTISNNAFEFDVAANGNYSIFVGPGNGYRYAVSIQNNYIITSGTVGTPGSKGLIYLNDITGGSVSDNYLYTVTTKPQIISINNGHVAITHNYLILSGETGHTDTNYGIYANNNEGLNINENTVMGDVTYQIYLGDSWGFQINGNNGGTNTGAKTPDYMVYVNGTADYGVISNNYYPGGLQGPNGCRLGANVTNVLLDFNNFHGIVNVTPVILRDNIGA